jgi:Restriction endonuclease BglII/DNA methylase
LLHDPNKGHDLRQTEAVLACEDNLSFMSKLPNGSMKLIVTSPPYNIGKAYERRSSLQRYVTAQEAAIAECVRLLHPNGSICWQVGNHVQNGAAFREHDWTERRTAYWVTADAQLIRKTMHLPPAQQKAEIEAAGMTPISSYNQTDFVKDRIAIEVQFGTYALVAYDLFVKHMAFYVGDVIDVGVETLPMKQLQQNMSSGVAYYEGELYNLIREGRGVPAVPLILIGVAP